MTNIDYYITPYSDIEFQMRKYETNMTQQHITPDDTSCDDIEHFKQPSSIRDIFYKRL